MCCRASNHSFLKADKISLDEEMGNLVELRLKNQANLQVLTSLPEEGG